MCTLEIIHHRLRIEIVGWHKLWAFKSRFDLSIDHVKSVDRLEYPSWFGGIRLGGTALPGVIRAGKYYQDGAWIFWDVCDMKKAITLELRDESYAKLILEVADPDATIDLLRQKIKPAP